MHITNSAALLALHNNDIHLWSISPQSISNPITINALRNILKPSEIDKIERYRHPEAQHNALITRAFIRIVLSQYAALQPQDWLFDIAKNGKPEINNSPLALRFNLSHNDSLIVCAVCLKHDIGCDVENLSRRTNIETISKRYFSAAEYQSLKNLPGELRRPRFFEYWTLKEAFVKATGLGLSQGLDSFSFAIEPATNTGFNDNIRLNFSEKTSEYNKQDWYSCLTYPDTTHCIAICIRNEKNNRDFKLSHFSGMQYLNAFAGRIKG